MSPGRVYRGGAPAPPSREGRAHRLEELLSGRAADSSEPGATEEIAELVAALTPSENEIKKKIRPAQRRRRAADLRRDIADQVLRFRRLAQDQDADEIEALCASLEPGACDLHLAALEHLSRGAGLLADAFAPADPALARIPDREIGLPMLRHLITNATRLVGAPFWRNPDLVRAADREIGFAMALAQAGAVARRAAGEGRGKARARPARDAVAAVLPTRATRSHEQVARLTGTSRSTVQRARRGHEPGSGVDLK